MFPVDPPHDVDLVVEPAGPRLANVHRPFAQRPLVGRRAVPLDGDDRHRKSVTVFDVSAHDVQLVPDFLHDVVAPSVDHAGLLFPRVVDWGVAHEVATATGEALTARDVDLVLTHGPCVGVHGMAERGAHLPVVVRDGEALDGAHDHVLVLARDGVQLAVQRHHHEVLARLVHRLQLVPEVEAGIVPEAAGRGDLVVFRAVVLAAACVHEVVDDHHAGIVERDRGVPEESLAFGLERVALQVLGVAHDEAVAVRPDLRARALQQRLFADHDVVVLGRGQQAAALRVLLHHVHTRHLARKQQQV